MSENTSDYFTIRMVEDIVFKKIKIIEETKHWLQIKYENQPERELRIIKTNIIFVEKI